MKPYFSKLDDNLDRIVSKLVDGILQYNEYSEYSKSELYDYVDDFVSEEISGDGDILSIDDINFLWDAHSIAEIMHKFALGGGGEEFWKDLTDMIIDCMEDYL